MSVLLSACGGGDNAPVATTSAATGSSSSLPTQAGTSASLKIVGQPPLKASKGSPYYFNANTTGGSGKPVAFAIINKPYWITFNSTTGTLQGTPDKAGNYHNIMISAHDDRSTVTTNPFSITVNGSSATTTTVTVTWAAPQSNTDGSAFDNPAGFIIHYGTDAHDLNQSVAIGSYNARSYNLSGLSAGSTYYFSVAAMNTNNIEGEHSAITRIVL